VRDVSKTIKLKWRKAINKLRHAHRELEIVKEISKLTAPEFQDYYEGFCRNRGIDIVELNKEHAERIRAAYGIQESGLPEIGRSPDSTEMIPLGSLAREVPEGFSCINEQKIHTSFSKLFKRLAVVIHPDKLNNQNLTSSEKSDMLDMFTKARSALEERKYFVLVDYAEKLKIPLPANYTEQVEWMRGELLDIEKKIDREMRSYNYLFSETDSEQSKDSLIKQFIEQLFQIKLK